MSKALTIDYYTSGWEPSRSAPRVGSHVRIMDSADNLEYDDFMRVLRNNGLMIDYMRWMPRLRANVYRIVRRRE
jgi:hypothetical protein